MGGKEPGERGEGEYGHSLEEEFKLLNSKPALLVILKGHKKRTMAPSARPGVKELAPVPGGSWCSPEKYKQSHRTPASDQAALTKMERDHSVIMSEHRSKQEHYLHRNNDHIPFSQLTQVITASFPITE